MSRLSLLWVCPAFPFPPTNGQQLRNSSILRALVELGHDVAVFAFGRACPEHKNYRVLEGLRSLQLFPDTVPKQALARDYTGRLRGAFSRVPYGISRFRRPEIRTAIRRALASGPVDAVICEGIHVCVNLPDGLTAPFILDNHNLEHLLVERYAAEERNPVKRVYAAMEARKLRSWEVDFNRRAAFAVVCSEHDRAMLSEFCPGRPIAVVPNIIDTEAYTPRAGEDPHTIVFSGGMDWYPNQQAAELLAREILPRVRAAVPGAQAVIAGRAPSVDFSRRFASVPGVSFTGTVRDMREVIARAAVCVVPLRIASGTRLKILEAAAMGKAVVSTSLGAEGLEFADGTEIIIENDPALFARAVAGLLLDPGRRRDMGAAARRRVQESYSYPVLRCALDGVLKRIGASGFAVGRNA